MKTWLAFLLLSGPLLAATPAQQNQTLANVGFSQNLDELIPLNLPFRNEQGQTVLLRDFFHGKPVILSLVYYQCPMLCTESLNGLVRAIRALRFTAGDQYNIVTVSFDPRETSTLAAAKKKVYLERYGRKGTEAGWAFLTGTPESIHRLTRTAGFHYTWDSQLGQYAHGTGILVLTPDGRISHYLYGVEYSAKDLRLALLTAADGRIGSPVDQLLLYCYHYDPMTGRYGLIIQNVLRLAGLATVLFLGFFILMLRRRETA